MHAKGVGGRGSLRCENYARRSRCKFVFYCFFAREKAPGGDLRAQVVGVTRWHQSHPSSIAEEKRRSQKNSERGKRRPRLRAAIFSQCGGRMQNQFCTLRNGCSGKAFFALERLMGKLNPADAGGMDATFRFAYRDCLHT